MAALLTYLDALPLWLRFVAGFVLLVAGAEFLVRGASRLARGFGISPLVVGLTVVAFGTSAPELAVSLGGSLTDNPDVAIGNIVGSNVMNVLLILGLAAVITPLVVKDQLVKFDVPILIAASLAVWAMARDGVVGRIEGGILVAALVAYLAVVFLSLKNDRSRAAVAAELDTLGPAKLTGGTIALNLAWIVIGLLGLTLGARWLVQGAVATATALGVSQLVIGLTVVAIGTSLPEIATSVMASIRGERDMAVGNVIGSNLFNLLCVLGLTAALPPSGVPVAASALYFDLPVMVAVAVVCLPIFFTGGRISRWEGALLLGYFFAYMGYVLLAATHHDALGPYSWVMLAFALPLTLVAVAVAVVVSVQQRRKRQARLDRVRRQRAAAQGAPAA